MAASHTNGVAQSVPSDDVAYMFEEFGECINQPPSLGSTSHEFSAAATTTNTNPTAIDVTTLRPLFTERRPQQVPTVAGDVDENGDCPVGLRSWLGHELDGLVDHPTVRRLEVVHSEKEADAIGNLRTNGGGLLRPVGLREKQTGGRTGRANDDPALCAAIVGERRRILDELEPDGFNEELDCSVVVVHEDRY